MFILDEDIKILNDSDVSYLNKKCETSSFANKPFIGENGKNYFFREYLDLKDYLLQNFITNIVYYVKNKLNNNNISLHSININRVDINSNKDDTFHFDNAEVSCLIYLNDDYVGGELEYKNGDDQIKIKPKKHSIIIMSDKLPHRVLPVTEGIRYSLVVFFVKEEIINPKTIKTII